ncbi:hypothetical protein AGMMS50276_07880 [Synergistales bacterium]|nr:hypothetical protein AGMMS50276_07880 [Synergistales bacterium]
MRVRDQITFEAKDDAEALRLAGERLGKDAVILSTRTVEVGGFFGLFKRRMLMVSAGILQDEQTEARSKPKEKDDVTSKERLVAFQKLLEFKQAAEVRAGLEPRNIEAPGVAEDTTKVIYSPSSISSGGGGANRPVVDSVHLSSAGLSSSSASSFGAEVKADANARVNGDSGAEIVSLKEQMAFLSDRLDMILQKLEQKPDYPIEESVVAEMPDVEAETQTKNFSAGLFENAKKDEPVDEPVQDVRDLESVAETVVQPVTQAVAQSDVQAVKVEEKNIEEKNIEEKNIEEKKPDVKPEDLIKEDEYYQRLLSVDVEPLYAFELVKEYRMGAHNKPFAKWLATKVPCAAKTSSDALGGRKVMLIGPTGVGKTTTIAKLAAMQALWDHKNVLLLTSDTYRIAAVDQLRTYAKILGVPIEVIFEVESFPGILEKHADAELILLDTAGRGQKDRKNLDTCEVLYDAFKPDAIHLVLAANMKYKDMRDVVKRMSVVPISRVIFTKIDETADYGSLLSVIKMLGSPVSFLTTGQNVPNDIEVASAERFVDMLLWNENEES